MSKESPVSKKDLKEDRSHIATGCPVVPVHEVEFDKESQEEFIPPQIIEIERQGSGHRSSIKGMSNLIHDEIVNED